MYRVLIIDDDEFFLESLKNLLVYKKFYVTTCANPVKAEKILKADNYHVILLDVKMPGLNGLDLLDQIHKYNPHIPVIMISGQSSISVAVDSIRKGAFDFVEKPIDPEKLQIALRNALERVKLFIEKQRLESELKSQYLLLGHSKALQEIRDTMAKIAPIAAKVLIIGETGTGKELVARGIHLASDRASGPFIKINCAAIPPSLLESELFGHKKGAFTGASHDYFGKFQAANGGTLFLDEIGDMDLTLQSKLLHVLQDNEFMMIGSNKSVRVDVRIIAATNQNLQKLISENRFREDLYHRLNVVSIIIPPLRNRKEDIKPLAYHFLKQFSETYNKRVTSISSGALKLLFDYHWPGNVRELRNVIEKLVLFADSDKITESEVDRVLPDNNKEERIRFDTISGLTLKEKLENFERNLIIKALEDSDGKVGKAAQLLGIDRTALFKKRRKLGI